MELPRRFYPRCIIGTNNKQRLVRVPVAFARARAFPTAEFWVFAKPLARALMPVQGTERAIVRRWREKDLVARITAPAWGADPETACACIRAVDLLTAIDIACAEFGVPHHAGFNASLLYTELSVALSTAVVPEADVLTAVGALIGIKSRLADNGIPDPTITRCFLEATNTLERLDVLEAALASRERAK